MWRELPTTLNVQEFSTSLFWTGDAVITIRPSNSGNDVVGEIYRPADGSVRRIAASGLEWRAAPAVVWTGSEVIVAGGGNGQGIARAAAAYNLSTDSWRALPAPPGFVSGRGVNQVAAPAVWLGQEMIAWKSNLAFNPTSNTWRAIPPAPLRPSKDEAVVATEFGVFVWGGCSTEAIPQCDERTTGDELADGAIYDPRANQWTELPKSPLGAGDHPTAVWTGDEVIVIVNVPADPMQVQTAAYNPSTKRWRALASSPQPGGRSAVTVWSGKLVVTHAAGVSTALDPSTGEWFRLPPGPVRDRHSGIWAGDRLVIAGGWPDFTPWSLQLATTPTPPGALSTALVPPPKFTGDQGEIGTVVEMWLNAKTVDAVIPTIENGERLRSTIQHALETAPVPLGVYAGRVDNVDIVGDNDAIVTLSILLSGTPVIDHRLGRAVRIDRDWKVSRETYCDLIAIGPARCPARWSSIPGVSRLPIMGTR